MNLFKGAQTTLAHSSIRGRLGALLLFSRCFLSWIELSQGFLLIVTLVFLLEDFIVVGIAHWLPFLGAYRGFVECHGATPSDFALGILLESRLRVIMPVGRALLRFELTARLSGQRICYSCIDLGNAQREVSFVYPVAYRHILRPLEE